MAVNHRVKRQPTEPSFRKKTADGARGGWAVPGRLGYGHMGYHCNLDTAVTGFGKHKKAPKQEIWEQQLGSAVLVLGVLENMKRY